MTQELIDLIQREVDGQNTPEDQALLRRHCEEDPSVKMELDGALKVGRVLDNIVEVSPPADFVHRVMDALPEHPSWQRAIRKAPSRGPLFRLTSRPVFTLAYGLVVGVFVTIFVMSGIESDIPVTDQLSGTMASSSEVIFSENIVLDQGAVGEGDTISLSAIQIEEGVQISADGSLHANDVITFSIVRDGTELFSRSIPVISR